MKRFIVAGVSAVFLYACGGGGMSVTLPGSVAKAQNASSCDTQFGSFEVSATGFDGPVTGTVQYKLWPCDKRAEIFLPPLSGVSNSTSFTVGPLPTQLIPISMPHQEHVLAGFDNDVEMPLIGTQIHAGDSTIYIGRNGSDHGWTASGRKGVGLQIVPIWLD